jgi:hypothetical protein
MTAVYRNHPRLDIPEGGFYEGINRWLPTSASPSHPTRLDGLIGFELANAARNRRTRNPRPFDNDRNTAMAQRFRLRRYPEPTGSLVERWPEFFELAFNRLNVHIDIIVPCAARVFEFRDLSSYFVTKPK